MSDQLRAIENGGSAIGISDGSGRPPAIGSGPVERLSLVRAVLPCPGCAHAAVCSIKGKLDARSDEIAFRTPPSPDPAIRIVLTATVSCEHFLADGRPAPVAEPVQRTKGAFEPTLAERSRAGHRGAEANRARIAAEKVAPAKVATGQKSPRTFLRPPNSTRKVADMVTETLAAIETTGSLALAAERLLISKSGLVQRLTKMRKAGLLPEGWKPPVRIS